MRSLARLAVLAPLALGPAALAAEGDAPPARSPSSSSPRQPAEARRVVIQPFTDGTRDAADQKLGPAVQQGLQSELAASRGLQVSRTDSPDARPDGDYAVSGTVQSVNGQLRITGQVYDVRAGRTLAPLKATGPANNFFAVQDDFARQAQAALGVAPSPATGGQSMYGSAYGSPAGAGAVDSGSHWAGYENLYDAGRSAPVMAYPPQMAPPPPPLYGYNQFGGYGGGYGYGGFGFGGGFYDGYGFTPGLLGGGTTRIERLGQLGVSNAPPPPTAFNDVRSRGAGSFMPTPVRDTRIPAYNAPVQDYRSPNTRFPSPVGQPQRVAPPNLRPGAPPATPAGAR